MAEYPSTYEPREPLVYRPISGLALVGFVVSVVFAAIVVLSTVVALVQGLPVFLPGWVLGMAVVAAVTCFVAQLNIRNAEGTLAGLALARWGLWLSILLGVTYFVYSSVTGLALTKQANDFLMVKSDPDTGFFPLLLNGHKNAVDLNQAFLLTLPSTSRGGSNAANEDAMVFQFDQPGKDGDPGNLSKFRSHQLVLALEKNPEAIKIEPLGVLEWKYEANSYHVLRNYRFTTPEYVFEAAIPVQSTEGAGEGEQRKWFVALAKVPRLTTTKPTPLGEKLLALRMLSKNYLERRRAELAQGVPIPEYKEADTDWSLILPKKELQRDHVKRLIGETFRVESKPAAQIMVLSDDHFADYNVVDNHVQIVHPMRIVLLANEHFPSFSVDLDCFVATQQPLDLNLPPSGAPVEWDIRKIRVTRAAVATKMGPPR